MEGKIARAIYEFVSGRSQEELRAVVGPVVADTHNEEQGQVPAEHIGYAPHWGGMRGYSLESLLKIANAAAKEHACNIDERVTLDVKRLISSPNSSTGKSALEDRQGLLLGPGALRPPE